MTRYKFTISYKGTNYFGYQYQNNKETIEKYLRIVTSKIFRYEGSVVASGRTDSGVHAIGQVFHLDLDTNYSNDRIQHSMNCLLPSDIRVHSVQQVDANFHSRYSVIKKEYQYLFTDKPLNPFISDYVHHVNFTPNISLFSDFKNEIIGTHDFIKLRNTGSSENTTVRTIINLDLIEEESQHLYKLERPIRIYRLRVLGKSFLYKMVRHIVGCMFSILSERSTIDDFKKYFLDNLNTFEYNVAPPNGLSLVRVYYEGDL